MSSGRLLQFSDVHFGVEHRRACQPRAVVTPRTIRLSRTNSPSWAGWPVAASNAFHGEKSRAVRL